MAQFQTSAKLKKNEAYKAPALSTAIMRQLGQNINNNILNHIPTSGLCQGPTNMYFTKEYIWFISVY